MVIDRFAIQNTNATIFLIVFHIVVYAYAYMCVIFLFVYETHIILFKYL